MPGRCFQRHSIQKYSMVNEVLTQPHWVTFHKGKGVKTAQMNIRQQKNTEYLLRFHDRYFILLPLLPIEQTRTQSTATSMIS